MESHSLNHRPQRRQYQTPCRRIVHRDRLTAECARIGLEIWEKATHPNARQTEFVIFRCKRCWNLHISRRRVAPPRSADTFTTNPQANPDQRRLKKTPSTKPNGIGSLDRIDEIRYLIEEFDLC